MKTKDFELKDIEAGCKFVTREGKEAINLHFIDDKSFFCVGGEVDEEKEYWSKGGKYSAANVDDHMDLLTVVDETNLIDPYLIPGFTQDLRLYLSMSDMCVHRDLIIKMYNEDYTVKGIADIVKALDATPVGNYVDALKEQPLDIKACIETGRIKCSEGPHESIPPQSIDNDPVNKPSHYTDGKIEVIDFIDDKGFDYCIGNAIKYLSRAGKKENEIQDLEKAVWYIQHKIKLLKNGTDNK